MLRLMIAFNLTKINLISSLFPEKCMKFNQSEWRTKNPEQPIRSQEILNLVAHLIRELFYWSKFGRDIRKEGGNRIK